MSDVLVSTYGGHRLGLGHIHRDIALARALAPRWRVAFHLDRRGVASELVAAAGVGEVLVGGLARAVRVTEPAVVLHDRPYAMGPMPELPEDIDVKFIGLDYFYYDDTRFDVVVNVKNHHLFGPAKIPCMHEGVAYGLVPPEIAERRGRTRPIGSEVRRVLVTFGGGDPRNNTKRALYLLEDTAPDPLEVDVVVGKAFRRGLAYPRSGRHSVRMLGRVPSMGPVIADSDVVFCGGGVTLMEVLTLGRPAVVVPQNDAERELAADIADRGACVLLPQTSPRGEAARVVGEILCERDVRAALATTAARLCDGRGLERVTDVVVAVLEGRTACAL